MILEIFSRYVFTQLLSCGAEDELHSDSKQISYCFSDKGFNAAAPANTVSFRQGSNVEFEGPSFVNTGGSGGEVRKIKTLMDQQRPTE